MELKFILIKKLNLIIILINIMKNYTSINKHISPRQEALSHRDKLKE